MNLALLVDLMRGNYFAFILSIFVFLADFSFADDAAPSDLSQSTVITAPLSTVRDKYVKIILHPLKNDVIKKSVDQTHQTFDDPKNPLAFGFSFSNPLLLTAFSKNRTAIFEKLNSILQNPELTEQILGRYESLLKDLEFGVDGAIRIRPTIGKAKLEINKVLTEEEKRKDAEQRQVGLAPGEVHLARADFQLSADPHIQFSDLNFYTIERPSEQKFMLPGLQIDLSDVKLGQPSWFYIISNFEQVFARKEEHVHLVSTSLVFNSGNDSDFKSIESFKPRVEAPAASRLLKEGWPEEKRKNLILSPVPVLIYSVQGLNGEWSENWVFESPAALKAIQDLQAKNKIGYFVRANITTEERHAPFQFKESWFGSNLSPNYLAEDTVNGIADQVFTPKMWAAVMDLGHKSSRMKEIGASVLKDFNDFIVPKLREKKISVWIYGEKNSDGTVTAHYQADETVYKKEVAALQNQNRLVFAFKAEVPLLLREVNLSIRPPLITDLSFQFDSNIPLSGELHFLRPGEFDLKSLGVSGVLKNFLKKFPGIDFTEAPLKFYADLDLSGKPISASIPITWHEKGPDIDTDHMDISLAILENAKFKNLEITWPHQEKTPLRLNSLNNDLALLLTNNQAPEISALLQKSTKGFAESLNEYLAELVKERVDPSNADRAFNVDTKEFKASIILESLGITPDMLQCSPNTSQSRAHIAGQGLNADQEKLLRLSGIVNFDCKIELPKHIQVLLKDIKTVDGSVDSARVILARKSETVFPIKVKVVKDKDDKLWVVPLALDPKALLASYDINISFPDGSEIAGRDWLGKVANSVQSTASSWSKGGFVTRWTGIQLASRKLESAIDKKEKEKVIEGILKAFEDQIPRILLNQSFYQLPAPAISEISLMESPTQFGDLSVPLEGSGYRLLESSAKRSIADFVHTEIQEIPAREQQSWKEYLRRELFKIPYYASGSIESAMFHLIQEKAFEPLSDQTNKFFRDGLVPLIAEATSSLLLKSQVFEIPTVGSICLIQNPSAPGLDDTYRVLAAAKDQLPAEIKVSQERLPQTRLNENQFLVSFGYEQLNKLLATNDESIRKIIEDSIKYEEDPVTHIRKPRSFVINPKDFQIEHMNARFERENGEPVFVVDTRFKQTFRMFSNIVPILGHLFEMPLRPFFNLDTNDIQIRISPKDETIQFIAREKGSEMSMHSSGMKSRKIILKKDVFRTFATNLAVAEIRKKMENGIISFPVDANIKKGGVNYTLKELNFENDWLSVVIEPILDPELQQPFVVDFNYENNSPNPALANINFK